MSNNRGLGKGLGALISMFDEDIEEVGSARITEYKDTRQTNETAQNGGTQEIDITLIDNNLGQPRKDFDPEAMHELEQSIMANGVLQPILLNKVGTRYMIVAGERRWRASKAVGLKTIPAIVRDLTQKQVAEIALVENLLRSDLNELEIANGIKKLMDTHNMTQEQISKVLGKSRSAIANSLRFLNLPPEVQGMLSSGKISAGHAKVLCAITDRALCLQYAQKCISDDLTVRELEGLVAGRPVHVTGGNVPHGTKQSLELRQFILELTQQLATKVSIAGDDAHGKIIIEYQTKRDLERIRENILK